MVTDDAPARRRLQRVLVFLLFALPALVLLALAVDSLAPAFGGIAARAPVVVFAPRDAVALPLAVAFGAFAAMTVLPASTVGPRRPYPAKADRAATAWLTVAAAALLATPVTPFIAGALVRTLLPAGYRECPPDESVRHAPLRWARPPATCPADRV